MTRVSAERRAEAKAAIRLALDGGAAKLSDLKARFSEIPSRTMDRYIQSERLSQGREARLTAPEPDQSACKAGITSERRQIDAPSKMLAACLNDLDRLRSVAVSSDGEVKNPKLLKECIAIRERLMWDTINYRERATAQYIECFYDEMLNILVEEVQPLPGSEPALRRILDRHRNFKEFDAGAEMKAVWLQSW